MHATAAPARRLRFAGARAPIELVWDVHGFVHVFAASVEDAYAGFGWAAGYERLWQIHLTTLYATATAASVLGPRFAAQDALIAALDVPGRRQPPTTCAGDALAEAFLSGLNAYVDQLETLPAEFTLAGTTARHYTLADLVARHRFASYHQHKPIMEKLVLARLMAAHGTQRWQHLISALTADDLALVRELAPLYARLDLGLAPLLQPLARRFSGSNNWAVRGSRSASGMPLLASDPHQAHSLPNTFLVAHLSAPGFDVMGASFPGTPTFIIGHTRHIAWGLTTGFVDNTDLYIEKLDVAGVHSLHDGEWRPLRRFDVQVARKGMAPLNIPVACSPHGPLLEPLLAACELGGQRDDTHATAIRWSIGETATAAGALARMPLARNVDEFGAALFEGDVTPLVNNLICVDDNDGMARWVAATLPQRHAVSGALPLPGWDSRYDFPLSRAADLCFDRNTPVGALVTANNDTLGPRTPFPIHNFPVVSARADRITELLGKRNDWHLHDFAAMQLDVVDVHARTHVPLLVELLTEAGSDSARLLAALLRDWRDFATTADAIGPTVWQALADSRWQLHFLRTALLADGLDAQPLADLPLAPMLNRWQARDLLRADGAFAHQRPLLVQVLGKAADGIVARLRAKLGDDASQWRYGRTHRIAFAHSQRARHAEFAAVAVGPFDIGGSPNTLNMASHLPDPTGEGLWQVVHGPVFRFVVDLADPTTSHWVMAGGNSARPDSGFTRNQFDPWLQGQLLTVSLLRPTTDESVAARVVLAASADTAGGKPAPV